VAIILGALTLPPGLVWSDEFAWSPVVQTADHSLSGALIVQTGARLAGRPITLSGWESGRDYSAWISRAGLIALQAALDIPNAAYTLVLHDDRTFTVTARAEGNGPLTVDPLPVYRNLPPANPGSQHWYIVREIRLLET
jgi:hypothetical protein